MFADSPWIPSGLPGLLAGIPEIKRCIGAMFDPWDNYPPDFYDRIFLCLQDFPAIGRTCAELILKMLQGKQAEKRILEIPPTEIVEIRGRNRC